MPSVDPIDRDLALEIALGRTDIYIDPEDFKEWLTWIGPWWAPELVMVETELFKAFRYFGKRRKERIERNAPPQGFRSKKPYRRLIPEAIVSRDIPCYLRNTPDGVVETLCPRWDAVDPFDGLDLPDDLLLWVQWPDHLIKMGHRIDYLKRCERAGYLL